jgi:CheY-like chemotaxis protein
LVALGAHTPSLILLDLVMPVMDGQRFREHQQRVRDANITAIPVVVVSGAPDGQAIARSIGAVDVVTKPIDLDRLVAVVQRYRLS